MQTALPSVLQEALQGGQTERARNFLQTFDAAPIVDPEFHWQIATISETLGETGRAIHEYNLVLRDQPRHREASLRLGVLWTEEGDLAHAEKIYRSLLQDTPSDPQIQSGLGQILSMTGREGEALGLYKSLPQDARTPAITQTILALEKSRLAASSLEDPLFGHPTDASKGPDSPAEEVEPSDADAIMFSHRFAGREGVYARQWYSETGKSGYTPVPQPFTALVARNHLLGSYTIGIYPLRMDHTILFLAFDIDIVQTSLSKAAAQQGPQALARLLRLTQTVARQILEAAAIYEIPVQIEDSGWKGRHVWIFFAEPVPAAAVRRLAEGLLQVVGPLPEDVRIEVFPKQARLQPKQLGNLIKLPLGIHRVTGRRCLWLDPEGKPLAEPLKSIHDLRTLSRSRLREILALMDSSQYALAPRPSASMPPPAFQPPHRPARRDLDPSASLEASAWPVSALRPPSSESLALLPSSALPPVPGSVSVSGASPAWEDESSSEPPPWADIPAYPMSRPPFPEPPSLPYHLDEDHEVQAVLRGCHVLRDLTERAKASGVLSREEQHTLIYTLGHLSQGSNAVNALLGLLLNGDPRSRLKSPLRGHPISCPKIRSKIPDVAASVVCNCVFAAHTGAYPSPLLHLHTYTKARSPGQLQAPQGLPQIEAWIVEMSQVSTEVARLQAIVKAIEERLLSALSTQGIREVPTLAGLLSITDEGKLHLQPPSLPSQQPPPVAALPPKPASSSEPPPWADVKKP